MKKIPVRYTVPKPSFTCDSDYPLTAVKAHGPKKMTKLRCGLVENAYPRSAG
jgi:hypothetical protein